MDPDPNRAARAQEMELKRQRLAEMRARKQEGDQNRSTALRAPLQNGNASRRETTSREELETLLRGVGVDTEPTTSPPKTNGIENTRPTSASAADTSSSTEVVGSRNLSLGMTKIYAVDVPFKDTAQYSKAIQTDEDRVPDREFSLGSQEFDFDDDMGMDSFRGRTHSHELESPLTDDIAQLLPNYFARHRGLGEDHEVPAAVEDKKHQEPPRDFSEEEKNQILLRSDFQQFFHAASKNVEKMLLGADERTLVDYTLDTTLEQVKNDDLLTLFFEYTEPKWAENRSVVGISFGKLHKELVVVAYDADRDQPQKPSGVVCVWNTHYKSPSPEYTYHSNSRLTSVTFAHFHKHLILAGCYSGQIVVWDYRIVTKKTPVNKSPLTNQTHTQPIFNLNVVGTRNSHGVCSVSSEGKICFWNIENLAQPILSRDLHNKSTRSVPTLSVSFCSDDADNFVAGSEDGKVYMFNKNTVGGNTIQASREFGGHNGPVLAIHTHLATGAVDFSHLFLTASSDWSIKLWSSKDPLLTISFESHEDMVADVKWSPVHPAVFASIDLKGLLLLWNLNETTENPVLTVDITKGEATLKKLAWSEDGRKLCVGDSKGVVYVYDTHENLYSVHNKEFIQFARVLAEVKKQAEEDETAVHQSLLTPMKTSNVAALASGGSLLSKKI